MRSRHTLLFALLLLFPAVALAADGGQQKLYVLESAVDTMAVVDVASNKILRTIEVGHEPHGLAATRSQDRLWVSAEGANELVLVDPLRDVVLKRYPIGRRPNEIDVTGDGRYVFIPALADGHYEVFDTEQEKIVKRIATDGFPHNVVVSSDDRFAYFSPMDRGPYPEQAIRELGLPMSFNEKVYVFDIAALEVAGTIPMPDAPRPIVLHPKGHRAYVNRDGLLGFEVLDTQARRHLYTAHYEMTREEKASPSRSHGIGITPDGKEVWSTDVNNDVVHVFDVSADEPRHVARLATGGTPLWLTVTPDGRTVYVSNTADDTVSAFDVEHKREVTRIEFEKGKAPKRILVLDVPTT